MDASLSSRRADVSFWETVKLAHERSSPCEVIRFVPQ